MTIFGQGRAVFQGGVIRPKLSSWKSAGLHICTYVLVIKFANWGSAFDGEGEGGG